MLSLGNAIFVCWIVFWIYWLLSAFKTKRTARFNIGRFAGIRIVIFVMAVILFRFHDVQNVWSEKRLVTGNRVILIAGFVIFLLGLALAIWARINLGKNWGTPMTLKEDPELVTSGPYAYIRHPIYSGILLAVVGCIIASSLFWVVILFIAGIYFIYSAIEEEKIMANQFPKAYPLYKTKTKMLIPFLF